MANTKITSAVIADNAVGIDQLNVSDGTNGQYLQTDGSGTLSFSTVSGYTDSDVETYLNTSAIYTDPTNDRLGLGTSSPTSQLDVNGVVSLKGNDFLDSDSSSHYIKSPTHLYLYSNGTDLNFALTANGNVGINITNPSDTLQVNGGVTFGADTVANNRSRIYEANGLNIFGGVNNNRSVIIHTNNTERLRVDSSGTLNIATTGGTWSGFTGKIENYQSSWANWGTSGTLFAHNARYDGTNYVALGTGKASRIWLNSNGMLNFETADSATAGSAVTYQNLMSLKKDSPTYQEVMEISSADRTLSTGQGAGIVFKGKINTDGSTTQLAQIVGFRDNTTNGYTSGGLSFYTRAVYTNPMVERIRIDEAGRTCFGGIKDLRADEGYVFGNSSSYGADATNMIKIRDDKGIADGASHGSGTGPDNGFAILSVTKQVTQNTAMNFFRFRNREGAGVAHIYYGFSMGGRAVQKIDKLAMTYAESTLTNEITKARGNETLTCSVSNSGDTHTISFTADQTQNVTATILLNSTGINSTTWSTNLDEL